MPCVDANDNDPGRVDTLVRAAVHGCWDALPDYRQSVEECERLVRKLVDRAIRDLREDATLFKGSALDCPENQPD
jgi:hypothetical protein